MYSVGSIENFPSGEIIDELVCDWFCKYKNLIKDRGAKPDWGTNQNRYNSERSSSNVFSTKNVLSRVSFQKSVDIAQSR